MILAAHASAARDGATLIPVFETLVRQRTLELFRSQQELDAANTRVMHLVELDTLTGLPNRVKFGQLLESEMQRSPVLSVLIVDLDEFKPLNDFLGRMAGDHALRVVAGLLRSECRSKDVVARIGGDRFGVLFPDTAREAALGLRERFELSIQSARVQGHPDLSLSATIGLASMDEHLRSAADVMEAAERDLVHIQTSRTSGVLRFPVAG